jgi:hypothetical protein
MKAARIALVVAVVLAPAASAHADVTIGSSLSQAADATPTDCVEACTMSPTVVPGRPVTPDFNGVITRWRVRAGTVATPVRLRVVRRPNGVLGPQIGEGRARSGEVTPTAGVVRLFTTRLPIAAGDFIALECCSPAGNFTLADAGATTDRWSTTTIDGAGDALPLIGTQILVNADVEPDGDTDGFGDETQDNCPAVGNPDQGDQDHDGHGNACDTDDDGDGIPDTADVCPTVAGAPPRGCPPVASPPNRPPIVRFRAPLAGAGVGPSLRIVLDVADDRGAPVVSVFDDDGTICVLRAAPYACTWTPTGADVGRATLLASAVDAAGLSTLGIVRVRVNRFAASLTTPKAKRSKRRLRVTGRLILPAVVTRAQGCTGNVTVRVRRVRRTVALTRRCTYAARLRVRTGRPRVSFAGNSVIAPT